MPDDVINANVMDAMIERWPSGAIIGMSSHGRQLLNELDGHPIETIDTMILRAKDDPREMQCGSHPLGSNLCIG